MKIDTFLFILISVTLLLFTDCNERQDIRYYTKVENIQRVTHDERGFYTLYKAEKEPGHKSLRICVNYYLGNCLDSAKVVCDVPINEAIWCQFGNYNKPPDSNYAGSIHVRELVFHVRSENDIEKLKGKKLSMPDDYPPQIFFPW